jgi:limonene 1,2-monooxygenase
MSPRPRLRLRFGAFIPPFHQPRENPTLALERDLALVERLEELGYGEAWFGEHHSGGWEIIASPEIMIAAGAERTTHIRLGTGVISLPYHHPFMVAQRVLLLDHLTRGRLLFGVGPGAIPNDARMLGISPDMLPARFEDALEAILALFGQTEPLSRATDGFVLCDAQVHLRPYTQPHPPLYVASSFSGRGLRMAARVGAGALQLGVGPNTAEVICTAERDAADAGHILDRSRLLLVLTLHLAESRAAALDAIRDGAASEHFDYWVDTMGVPRPDYDRLDHVDHMIETGRLIAGTSGDCIDAIRQLMRETGPIGGILIAHREWASAQEINHSYELFAREVIPALNALHELSHLP